MNIVKTICISSSIVLGMASCQTPEKIECIDNAALFDYVSYQGADKLYNSLTLDSPNKCFNPILSGWNSDPSICTDGKGNYYLAVSTFVFYPGVQVYHSTDLMNWILFGNCLTKQSQLEKMEGQHTSGGIFAPQISYNKNNGYFYMITTNVGAGNFFVKTKDPRGTWSDPVYLPNVNGIDPSFFWDEDGKGYIIHNSDPEPEFKSEYDGHKVARVHNFDVEKEETFGDSWVIVNKGVVPEDKPIWLEGPHLYKIGEYYYMMAAEGGTSEMHSEVLFRSKSLKGGFEPWTKNPILTQRQLDKEQHNRPNPITCAGHADIIQTANGDWYGVFLACRPIDNDFENLGRETFIMPIKWEDDWFYFTRTENNDLIPYVVEIKGATRGENPNFGNFGYNENFDADTLSYDWFTLRSKAEDCYSLSQNKGFLTLKCKDISSHEKKTPAAILRRLYHHEFEMKTRMIFNPKDSNQKAGLLVYKDDNHQYFACLGLSPENKKCIQLLKIQEENVEILKEQVVDDNVTDVTFQLKGMGKTFGFFYSLDQQTFVPILEGVDAKYTSTKEAWGFTGTEVGPYATSKIF